LCMARLPDEGDAEVSAVAVESAREDGARVRVLR
jgi:hypothetical protein